jgi:signal transduction histidine kinase
LDIIEEAARKAELRITILRIAFCALAVARFVSLISMQDDPNVLGRWIQVLPVTLATIVFSVWMIGRLRRARDVKTLMLVSVIVDAVVCAIVVSANAFWPFPDYPGVLRMPDTSAFLAMIMAAGYRVYPKLAIVGASLNIGLLAAIVGCDLALHSSFAADLTTLYALLVAAAAVIAVSSARRTIELVRRARSQSLRLERAEREFGVMLMDHHDASSLLSAARLDVENLRRAIPGEAAIEQLGEDLKAVTETIGRLRQRAHAEALSLGPLEEVEIARELHGVQAQLERVVEPMRVVWEVPPSNQRVSVPGGVRAIRRVLLNLLTNAREGDGKTGAATARVRMSVDGADVRILVADDGPGCGPRSSDKPQGTGTGLLLVESVVNASGGDLEIERAEIGTVVTIRLPSRAGAAAGESW